MIVNKRLKKLRFEYGTARPKLDTVIKLDDFFDVSTDYLPGRSDNPTRIR